MGPKSKEKGPPKIARTPQYANKRAFTCLFNNRTSSFHVFVPSENESRKAEQFIQQLDCIDCIHEPPVG